MTAESSKSAFFVGYLAMPRALGRHLGWVTAVIIAILIGGGAGFLLGMRDPGDGRFRGDLGRVTLTGIVTNDPYPTIHLAADEDHPNGRSVLLIGSGKFGVEKWAGAFEGQTVNASGFLVTHNAYEMMVIGSKKRLEAMSEGAGSVHSQMEPMSDDIALLPQEEIIGDYTLKGEVVDSKCAIGAMRPGIGKAHRGCGNLCLLGDVPPMLMVHGPKGAFQLFLLTGNKGEPIADKLTNGMGLFVEASGTLVRRGGMIEFRINPESMQLT